MTPRDWKALSAAASRPVVGSNTTSYDRGLVMQTTVDILAAANLLGPCGRDDHGRIKYEPTSLGLTILDAAERVATIRAAHDG